MAALALSEEEREAVKKCFCARIKCGVCYNRETTGCEKCVFPVEVCIDCSQLLK